MLGGRESNRTFLMGALFDGPYQAIAKTGLRPVKFLNISIFVHDITKIMMFLFVPILPRDRQHWNFRKNGTGAKTGFNRKILILFFRSRDRFFKAFPIPVGKMVLAG